MVSIVASKVEGESVSGPIRFVHAADLHLDAPFKGVDASDPRVREALLASTYEALERVVDVCLDHEVDFLVLAGDVYNAGEPSLRAQFAFREACERLAEAGVRVFVARGNHDATATGMRLPLPDNVHEFSAAEVDRVSFEREDGATCAIYGRSFRTSAEKANFAAAFRRQASDAFAIGVLHTNVGGRPGHEPYAPCSLEDLRAAGMDYWALGHIHKPEVLGSSPEIVYPGCTQGLNPNESGVRGCRLVTLEAGGVTSSFISTASIVWDQATVDASELVVAEDLLDALTRQVDLLSAAGEGRPAIVRLTLTGRSPAHAVLARPGALVDIVAEISASSIGRDPWVWVDRVSDRTRPTIDLESIREGQDLAGDLVRLADALAGDETAGADFIGAVASPLLARLDSRDAPMLDEASLIERARDLALDRLLAGEER